MESLTIRVFKQRIRTKLRASERSPPRLDGFAQRFRHTVSPVVREDEDAFQKKNGRGVASINRIMAEGSFCEASRLAGIGAGDEYSRATPTRMEPVGKLAQMVLCRALRPEHAPKPNQVMPGGDTTALDLHSADLA